MRWKLFYTLDGQNNPVPTSDAREWARFLDDIHRRVVAHSFVGHSRVSTVFLGMDYNVLDRGPPMLFETRVIDGALDGDISRCTTWEQAESDHQAMCNRVRFAEDQLCRS